MITTAINRLPIGRLVLASVRNASTKSSSAIQRVTVERENDGIAILTLNNPPVNILTSDILNAYAKELKALDNDPSCRGVIVASACEKAFSAGLDINVFCSGDVDRLRSYWISMQELWYQTYQTRLATVAAVNGAAIAGGCVLAICCDIRVMADSGPKAVIGLNETKLGIAVPFWINDRMIQLLGYHKAEQAILSGGLYNAQSALNIGLIDRCVGSGSQLMDAARHEIRQMLEIPDHARAQTKRAMRQAVMDKFLAQRQRNVEELVDVVTEKRTQSILQAYLATLTKRKEK